MSHDSQDTHLQEAPIVVQQDITYWQRMRDGTMRTLTGTFEVAPCGSETAYRRHLKRAESVDAACQAAHRAECKRYDQRRKARLAALRVLGLRHPTEYEALYRAALAAEQTR